MLDNIPDYELETTIWSALEKDKCGDWTIYMPVFRQEMNELIKKYNGDKTDV